MAENTYSKKDREKIKNPLFGGILDKTENVESVLEKGVPTSYIPRLLFIAFLGIIYIANSHYAEKMVRETSKLEAEVENMRADHATLKAEYDQYTGRQSIISEKAAKMGLVESKGKIQKIPVKKSEY